MYTKKDEKETPATQIYEERQIYDSMNITEKWIYFIFKKDIR
jgi:hypothetical protein